MNAEENDYVYRAFHPKRVEFVRLDGSIAPAAFIDPKGLSVEQGLGRTDGDVVAHLRQTGLQGRIAKISVKTCNNANITIYNDNAKNVYHRLLLDKPYDPNGNNKLSRRQAVMLADNISRILDDKTKLFT